MIDVLRLFGPIVLWLASFSAVYGLQGLSCAQGWSHGVVVIAWLVTIALQVAALLVVRSPVSGVPAGSGRWASLALAIVGVVAIVWTLFPVVLLTACT
jgi:hypothetical protein